MTARGLNSIDYYVIVSFQYKVLREDKRKIDFGIMGTNDDRQVLFALYNHNPTKVSCFRIMFQ